MTSLGSIFTWNRKNDALYSDIIERVPPVSPAPPAVLAKPQPVAVSLPELPYLTEYEEVARTLGFHPPELAEQAREIKRREVIGFLLDNGFPIYEGKDVHAFMSKLAAKEGKVFCWARLDRDAASIQQEYHENMLEMRFAAYHSVRTPDHGQIVATHYQRPVPLNILKRASAIKKRFGDEVSFYVSDYASVDPDPFIAVKRGDCALIIFGVWDEPSFGGTLKRDRDGR